MNLTKKMLLTAGVILQLTGSIYSSYNLNNWANAFLNFGGGTDPVAAANYVISNQGKSGVRAAINIASQLQTQEGYATAAFLSGSNNPTFNSSYQASDVIAAAQAIARNQFAPVMAAPMAQPVQQAPAMKQAPIAQPVQQAPAAPAAQSNSVSSAALQSAVQAQQAADAAAAAASNQALASLVNSGATGLNLYTGYIDLIFNLLQQAINAIVDPSVQQQVIGYAQNKLAGMKSAAANQYSSHTLGRMSSKKADKKAHKRS